MEDLLKTLTVVLARGAETCGALVIGYAVVRAAVFFVLNVFQGPAGEVPNQAIRLDLGRALALGLEFLLGADILNTAIAPSWQQIGMLAAIAAIRTGLNYFLQKELDGAVDLQSRRAIQKSAEVPLSIEDRSAARAVPHGPRPHSIAFPCAYILWSCWLSRSASARGESGKGIPVCS